MASDLAAKQTLTLRGQVFGTSMEPRNLCRRRRRPAQLAEAAGSAWGPGEDRVALGDHRPPTDADRDEDLPPPAGRARAPASGGGQRPDRKPRPRLTLPQYLGADALKPTAALSTASPGGRGCPRLGVFRLRQKLGQDVTLLLLGLHVASAVGGVKPIDLLSAGPLAGSPWACAGSWRAVA